MQKVASNRLTRWSILLQPFNFTIQHKPGTELDHADALTRLLLLSDPSEQEDLVINNAADDLSEEWLSSLQQATQSDSLAKSIMTRVTTSNWNNLKPEEKYYYRHRDKLTVQDQLTMV